MQTHREALDLMYGEAGDGSWRKTGVMLDGTRLGPSQMGLTIEKNRYNISRDVSRQSYIWLQSYAINLLRNRLIRRN